MLGSNFLSEVLISRRPQFRFSHLGMTSYCVFQLETRFFLCAEMLFHKEVSSTNFHLETRNIEKLCRGGGGGGRKSIIYWQNENFQYLSLAGKGFNIINAAGWHPQRNV